MDWTKVEDGLPEIGEPVLIYSPDSLRPVKEAHRAIPYEAAPHWHWSTPHGRGAGMMILPEHVTHWRPLPDPPSE